MMRILMNTALSGSGRVDDIKSHPKGGRRGATTLVKITEDVRKYAAEQGLAEQTAIEEGLKQKASEYRRAGAGGIDSPKGSPQGPDDGKQPDQFQHSGAEIYSKP